MDEVKTVEITREDAALVYNALELMIEQFGDIRNSRAQMVLKGEIELLIIERRNRAVQLLETFKQIARTV